MGEGDKAVFLQLINIVIPHFYFYIWFALIRERYRDFNQQQTNIHTTGIIL
jgi:hypothetical protein